MPINIHKGHQKFTIASSASVSGKIDFSHGRGLMVMLDPDDLVGTTTGIALQAHNMDDDTWGPVRDPDGNYVVIDIGTDSGEHAYIVDANIFPCEEVRLLTVSNNTTLAADAQTGGAVSGYVYIAR